MHVNSPTEYFADCSLRESRVLGFAFNERTRQVLLDIDYSMEAVSHWFEARLAGVSLDQYRSLPADFRRFTFFEVAWLSIDSKSPLAQTPQSDSWANALKPENAKGATIVAFDLIREGDNFITALALTQMGTFHFKFRFARIYIQRRRGISVQDTKNGSLYEDIKTKEIFDACHPFPVDC